MIFVQNKSGNKHTFTLNNESFNFAYEDSSGSGDLDIDYSDFPIKNHIRIDQNYWLRNVGLLWTLLGIYDVGQALYFGKSLSGTGFWLIIGLGCIAWSYARRIKYSVFQTSSGGVFVIQDASHDALITELHARRIKQMMELYGDINEDQEPEKEIAKFKWLLDQHVLTQAEYDRKILAIKSLKHTKTATPVERFN